MDNPSENPKWGKLKIRLSDDSLAFKKMLEEKARLQKPFDFSQIPIGYTKDGNIQFGPEDTKITLATGLSRFPEHAEWETWLRFEKDMRDLDKWEENVKRKIGFELKGIDCQIHAATRERCMTTNPVVKASRQQTLADLHRLRHEKRQALSEFMEKLDAKRSRLIVEIEERLRDLFKIASDI